MKKTMVLHPLDNVCIAMQNVNLGDEILVQGEGTTIRIRARDSIPFGHKVAITPIKEGDKILKYGETIGVATEFIEKGSHVHIHNVEGVRTK